MKKRLDLRQVDSALWRKIQLMAIQEKRSIATMAKMLLEEALDQREREARTA